MAYAFDNINNLLDPAQQQGGTNIFSSGQTAQSPDQPQSAAGQSGSAAKTSTEGELSPGGSGSSTTGAQTNSEKATPQSSGAAILEKAKGENYNTEFANKIVGDVKAGQQNLQNQANQYIQAQRSKAPQQLQDQDVEAGLAGDAAARNKVENVIRGPGVNADSFNANVASRFEDIDQIGSQGGLQAYLQKRGGERYNAGQAALDSLLFSRDKGFQDTVAKARAEKQALRQQQADLDANLQRQEQENLNLSQANAKAQAKALLKQKQDAQRAVLQQRADDLGRRFSEDSANVWRFGDQKAAEEYNKFAATLSPEDKIRLGMVKDKVNVTPYATNKYAADVNKQYGYRNSGTAEQAARYNNILALLGEGGDTVQAGDYAGDAQQFNAQGYQEALRNALAMAPRGNAIGGTVASGSNGAGGNAASGLADLSHRIQNDPANSGQTLAQAAYNAGVSSIPGGSSAKKKLKL